MKTKIAIGILILALFSLRGYGQRQFQKPLKASTQSSYSLGKMYLGGHLGCPWSVMSVSNLSATTYLGHWGYRIGVSGEYFFPSYSVGLNASFAEKGSFMKNGRTFQMSMNQNGTMENKMHIVYDVVTLRIPFTFYFRNAISSKRVMPYVFVSPEVDLPMPFLIEKAEDAWKPAIGTPFMETTTIIDGKNPTYNKQTITPNMDLGAVAGAGMLFMLSKESASVLLKVDVGMYMGLFNQANKLTASPGLFIRNQGLEVNATLLFHLKKPLHDACHTFRGTGYQ